jgi:drug/metabolite transporter (DMT)-like permease
MGLASGDAAKAAQGSADGSALALAAADERRAVLFGIAAALCFGMTIYSTAQAGMVLPPFLAVLPVRIVGITFILIPMALSGRLRLTRPAVPLVILIGTGEVLGNAAYVMGARESIAIAAVLASQFAAVAAVAAFFIFHERLSVQQRFGIIAICLGVAALTVARG